MSVDPQVVLLAVGGIMLALAIRDLIKHRSLTPAVKTRLLVAALFAAVWLWNTRHLP